MPKLLIPIEQLDLANYLIPSFRPELAEQPLEVMTKDYTWYTSSSHRPSPHQVLQIIFPLMVGNWQNQEALKAFLCRPN